MAAQSGPAREPCLRTGAGGRFDEADINSESIRGYLTGADGRGAARQCGRFDAADTVSEPVVKVSESNRKRRGSAGASTRRT